MRPVLSMRKLLVAAALGGLVLGAMVLAGGATSSAAPGGGGCQVAGTATFSPNGPGTTSSFNYSLAGALSTCQSNVAGAPASGTIGVGQVLTEPVTITTPTGPVAGTAQYQEPLASGNGNIPVNSCAAGATSGTAVVQWPDSTTTVASYTTQSAGAAVNLQGSVIGSVNLTLVPGSASPAGTAPATFVLSSTNTSFPAGDGAQGALTFTTSSPTQCNTAAGLTSADIKGFVGLGSTS